MPNTGRLRDGQVKLDRGIKMNELLTVNDTTASKVAVEMNDKSDRKNILKLYEKRSIIKKSHSRHKV